MKDMAYQTGILPLRLQGLGFEAGGKHLLKDVSLEVERGERLLILGPNGAGKSLLLRLCHGLLTPSRGQVLWACGSARPAAQAMVFQRPVVLRRSARANLDQSLSLAGTPRDDRPARISAALELFGLTPLADRGARLLSGGEQQRLALARAWLMRPEILFLDEPTSALDPASTRMIEEAITAFNAEGMTIVMTSHNLGQARRLASRVAFLSGGRLLETASAERFFSAPQTREARAYLDGDLVW